MDSQGIGEGAQMEEEAQFNDCISHVCVKYKVLFGGFWDYDENLFC